MRFALSKYRLAEMCEIMQAWAIHGNLIGGLERPDRGRLARLLEAGAPR